MQSTINIRLVITIYILAFIPVFYAQSSPPITLEELQNAYRDLYVSSHTDSIDWQSKSNCDPGKIPSIVYLKAENRINFFRMMNRLPLIKVTPAKQKEAQAAALMMEKNKALNHNPPKNWICYSNEGAEGAKNSCLGLSNFKHLKNTAFITGFIADPGDQNYFVGHRRWLLYSKATEFSLGATKSAMALYCTNNLSKDTIKNAFIAFPWNGFVPVDLLFSKWSFAIPETNEVNYSNVKVTIKNKKGIELPVQLFQEEKNAPDRVITWKVDGLFSAEEEKFSKNSLKEKGYVGEELNVKVENVKTNGKISTYEYKVKITEVK
jgi:hypothetical protein